MIKKTKKERPKIYERNPNTGVVRWRYIGEPPNKEKTLKKTRKVSIKKKKR